MPKRRPSPETIHRAFTTRAPFSTRHALLGIRALDARHRSRLARAVKDEASAARLQKKIADAQVRLLAQSGLDARVLRRLSDIRRERARRIARRLRKRSAAVRPVPPPPAFAGSQLSLLTPPYTWEFSNTWVIDYAPGQLSATADKALGTMRFVDNPAISGQVDRSGGSCAVGFYFQPSVDGVLTIVIPAPVHYLWALESSFAGANTRGWGGLIVQSFPVVHPRIGHFGSMFTPVLQQHILFDEGTSGNLPNQVEGDDEHLTYTFQATLAVDHRRWYAIWLWCGGDIHAEGEGAANIGSLAVAELEIQVPYVILDFNTP